MIIVYLLMKYQKLQKKFGAFLLSRVVIIIIVVVVVIVVVVGHLKSFQPQKQRFSPFENNTRRTEGHDLL